jgi:hypothetical protein
MDRVIAARHVRGGLRHQRELDHAREDRATGRPAKYGAAERAMPAFTRLADCRNHELGKVSGSWRYRQT